MDEKMIVKLNIVTPLITLKDIDINVLMDYEM